MEDVIVRRRLPRHNIPARRKKRNNRPGENPLVERIARQVLICVVILLVIGIIKSVNTPVTNFVSQKVKDALSKDMELRSIYDGIDSAISGFRKNKAAEKKEEPSFDEEAVAASTGLADTESDRKANADIGEGEAETEEALEETPPEDDTADKDGTVPTPDKTDSSKEGPAQKGTPAKTPAGKSLFIMPVDGKIGSPFGNRIHPQKKTNEPHKGIDIEANSGVPIKASRDGEVIEAGTEATYGKYIKIKHADGFTSIYAHCSALTAKKGSKVKQGEVIAKVGNTGASMGPHLHFEIRKDGKPVNPMEYVNKPAK